MKINLKIVFPKDILMLLANIQETQRDKLSFKTYRFQKKTPAILNYRLKDKTRDREIF